MKWRVMQIHAERAEILEEYLAKGWEPYAVVFIPGVGAVHFLRKASK